MADGFLAVGSSALLFGVTLDQFGGTSHLAAWILSYDGDRINGTERSLMIGKREVRPWIPRIVICTEPAPRRMKACPWLATRCGPKADAGVKIAITPSTTDRFRTPQRPLRLGGGNRSSCRVPGGVSPPGAPRSVREPLDSYGSRCSAVSVAEPPVGKERWICSV
jgi:hypothetical protein